MTGQRSPRRPAQRADHDYYPTPPEALHALLSVEKFDGTIWEPACGEGALATELIAAGYAVTSSDLINRGYGIAPVDFLTQSRAWAKNIVTNPPYGSGLADRFIEHALTLTESTGGAVAMLLNLASLCHPLRHGFWTSHPPAVIYGLDALVCWPYGIAREATNHTTQQRYMWCVWRPGSNGQPRFWWLATEEFRHSSIQSYK